VTFARKKDMATRTNKDSVQLSLKIDGKDAVNTIQELDAKSSALVKEMQLLEDAGQQATEAYRKLEVQRKELLKQSNQAYEASKRASEQQARLSVNEGKSIKTLQGEYRQLLAIVNNLEPTHKDFNAQVELLHKKKAKIDEIKASFKGVKEEVEAADNATKGMGGSLSNVGDYVTGGLITGGITAVADLAVQGAQEIAQMVEETAALRREINQLTGATGEALDEQTVKVLALSETFQKEEKDTLLAMNTLTKEFNVTFEEASDRMQTGFLAGADVSGEFLDNIKEYSVQFAAAGFSADEFIAISTRASKEGIFSDKGLDVVKEFGLRIREQTTASRDALIGAFGPEFTGRLFKGLNDGSVTTVDALKLVARQMDENQVPAKQLQTVIADVFGGAGEDAGLRYIQSLKDIEGTTVNLVDVTSEYVKQQIALQTANEALATSQNELTKQLTDTGNSLSVFWANVKSGAINVLVDVLQFFEQFSATWKGITAGIEQVFTNAVNRVKSFVVDVEISFAQVRKLNPFGETSAQIDREIAALRGRKETLAAESVSVGKAYRTAFLAGLDEVELRKRVAAATNPAAPSAGGGGAAGGGGFQGQDPAAVAKKNVAAEAEAKRLAEAQAERDRVASLLDTTRQLEPLQLEAVQHTETAKLKIKEDASAHAMALLGKEMDHFKAFEDEKAAKAKETSDKLNAIEAAKYQFAQQTFSGIVQLLSADEAARKKNAKAIKAFSTAEVFTNLFQEISGIWKNANTNPLNALFPGAGTAIAVVQSAFAGARAQLAVANIQKQKFAKGGVPEGPSHQGGGIQLVAPGGRIVGEMEGGEPILSRSTYANNKLIIDRLLFSSMYKGGAPIFATGGFAPSSATLASQASLGQSTQRAEQLYEAMLMEQMRTRQAIEAMPTTLRADVSLRTIQDAGQTLGDILKAAAP
jgi:hypothetical protein